MSVKAVLRSQVRKGLATALASSGPRPDTGMKLVQRLKDIPEYQNSKCVSIFLSMPSEVPTIDIIYHAMSSGKRVVVPKIIGPEPTDMLMIELSKISDIESFPKSKWGIPEPPPEYIATYPDLALSGLIDLVLVPGTAFDRRCGRLGQGKGYYDSFLARVPYFGQRCGPEGNRIPTIGLGFDEQIIDQVPMEPHDRFLDYIVTPSSIISKLEQ